MQTVAKEKTMGKFTAGAKKIVAPKRVAKVAVGVTHDSSFKSGAVTNYMASTSWTLDPIATLRMRLASSIFGEPAYYESGNKRAKDMTDAIDAALSYDFDAAIRLASELRNEAWHRLNPQVLLTRAAMHVGRETWTKSNPGEFARILDAVARRPDDITGMLEYFIATTGDAKSLPGILKRAAAKRLSSFSKYHIAKYKNAGIGLIDVVRIVHASSDAITELMKNGTIELAEADMTPRSLKSQGKSWKYIIFESGVRVTHDDYLYNIRGMLSELDPQDRATAKAIAAKFVDSAVKSKIWPYKYWVAYRTIKSGENFNHRQIALDAISDALDVVTKLTTIPGRVDILVDNSGSARGGKISEAGSAYVYEVGNLSGVITAMQAEEGTVWVFGDKLTPVQISKRESVLSQVEKVNRIGDTVGQATENGIWLYFEKMIKEKTHVDTVFIYSDMQAGRGGLYGINPSSYREYMYGGGRNIDVWKLVDAHRKVANKRMNVFSVQIAGYDNSVMPENNYRGANISGWTGKEAAYAMEITKVWDQVEAR